MTNQQNHLVGFPVKWPHFNFILLLETSTIWFQCTYELLPASTHICLLDCRTHYQSFLSHVMSTDILWPNYYLNFLFTNKPHKIIDFIPLKKKKCFNPLNRFYNFSLISSYFIKKTSKTVHERAEQNLKRMMGKFRWGGTSGSLHSNQLLTAGSAWPPDCAAQGFIWSTLKIPWMSSTQGSEPQP